ncbi:hypothetical protein PENSPDRAFT_113134 [Peniophora sp. CONT]|nr:hypothetical protein PENSPDRAFT_113134 [Peniophora sp. CONT]
MSSDSDAHTNSNESAGPLNLDPEALRVLEMHTPQASSDSVESVTLDAGGQEEEALESHEVIELQAFSERKEWIVEKIKLLESMPPLELFVGLDAVRASALEVPGLPTRDELKQWLAEHDKIEKETEIFDSGELKKFKKITKAAAKRNLSPQDTDLIEITLTTIFEFDKLLHLLRDRSEQLDLLGVRLTWEEHRTGAWSDRTRILEDLSTFLSTRAKWSPAVYESVPPTADASSPARRGSITSLKSNSSSNLASSGFSRAARYTLAENLSREAAGFSSRITTLRHSRIAGAGKALDRLIDNSRKPVPEVLLDEQDKLEERGIAEMENVGKFVMDVVTQWRKADEFYVETLKDQAAAQQLLDEIDAAKTGHPVQRTDATFTSKANAISKRLQSRDITASPVSLFPRPRHALFPTQTDTNKAVTDVLDAELAVGRDAARKAEEAATEYHKAFEAVKLVESISASVTTLAGRCDSILAHLSGGVEAAADADGSPVNLDSVACLHPTAHSTYLALLPSLLRQLDEADSAARDLLPKGRAAMLGLSNIAVDPDFKTEALAALDRLSSIVSATRIARSEAEARVRCLREVRKIWTSAEGVLQDLSSLKSDAEEAVDRGRWRPQPNVLATPESIVSPLPSIVPAEQLLSLLTALRTRLAETVSGPIASLSAPITDSLNEYLSHRATCLSEAVDQIERTAVAASAVDAQALALRTLHEDAHIIQEHIGVLRERYREHCDDTLSGAYNPTEWNVTDEQLSEELSACEHAVINIVSSVPSRVLFVGGPSSPSTSPRRRRQTSSGHSDVTLDSLPSLLPLELPINLSSVDDDARSSCNTLTSRLHGDVDAVKRAATHSSLARRARDLDEVLVPVRSEMASASEALKELQNRLEGVGFKSEAGPLFGEVAESAARTQKEFAPSISQALETAQLRMVELVSLREKDEDPSSFGIVDSRAKVVDDMKVEFEGWVRKTSTVHEQAVAEQRRAEEAARKVREEAEAERVRVEEERVRLEEEERRRLEEERLKAEERARSEAEEQERLKREEKEQRERDEAERVAREKEERRVREEEEERRRVEEEQARLEREKREADERERLQRLETKRLAQEARERAEREEAERRERELNESREREAAEKKQREEDMERRLQEEVGKRMKAAEEKRQSEDAERRRRRSEGIVQRTASLNEADEDAMREAEEIFGSPSRSTPPSEEMISLSRIIHGLRERLKELGINSLVRPSKSSRHSSLPSKGRCALVAAQFAELSAEVAALPATADHTSVEAELRSLRADILSTEGLLQRLVNLAALGSLVQECDSALSDLLEHVDSFPGLPMGPLAAGHTSSMMLTPEEQLSARMAFTGSLVDEMDDHFAKVADDPRASGERTRISQTWNELEAMASDRVQGRKSRPPSTVSSGRSSRASIDSFRPTLKKKTSHYSTLSVGSSSRASGQFLTPGPAHPSASRRSVSNRESTQSRSASRVSTLSSRSTSGPMNSPSPSTNLFSSTYASRQRTSSVSSNAGTPSKPPTSRPRAQTGQRRSVVSPTPSDTSTGSRSFNPLSRSTNSSRPGSTFGRAPRLSFSSTPRSPPPKAPPRPRKAYVANPKNKLDVAVGEVVNNLPTHVDIDIEVAEGTDWQDQSGKYWIGTEDPKLCFCRILRSQTVMVRVGGGWQELSRFIQNHFADSFRLMPEHMPHVGSRDEKWISSTTLLEAQEPNLTPPRAPKTPEPNGVPSFVFQTPNARSPHSLKSSPSPGSPLTPLQFMRRADHEGARPGTPSKAPVVRQRLRSTLGATRPEAPVWKP